MLTVYHEAVEDEIICRESLSLSPIFRSKNENRMLKKQILFFLCTVMHLLFCEESFELICEECDFFSFS